MADDDKKPIHGQPGLCDHILRSVSSSTVPLEIGLSSIANAGSGLFVLNPVPAGSEIFRSDPLLLVCDGNNKGICDYCFRNNNSSVHPDGRFFDPGEKDKIKIMACTRCECAQYCSKDCQARAWKSYHKYECAMLKDVKDHDRSIGALPQALCRLLFWIKKQTILKADLDVLAELETHGHKRTKQWLDSGDEDSAVETTFSVAQTAKKLTRSPIDLALARQLYCMLVTNAAEITPAEVEDTYGDCFDLLLSLINHSCAANAHVFFENRQLQCRAVQDIPAGCEITVHYHPHPRQDVLLRRKFLKESLFIVCNCEKCKAEMSEHVAAAVDRQDHLRILQQAQLDLQNAWFEAETAFNSHRIVQVCIDFQQKIWAILQRGYPEGRWPNHLQPLPVVYLGLGAMYFELKYVIGLEFVLKGTIYGSHRRGPIWARELLYLTKFIVYVAQAGEDDIKWTAATKNAELLDRATMRNVARGYACIVALAGKFAFGMDNRFVRALYTWAGDIVEYPGDPDIHTEVFKQRFGDSQERLLTWACMKPDEGLSLPSSNDIAELKREIESVRAKKEGGRSRVDESSKV